MDLIWWKKLVCTSFGDHGAILLLLLYLLSTRGCCYYHWEFRVGFFLRRGLWCKSIWAGLVISLYCRLILVYVILLLFLSFFGCRMCELAFKAIKTRVILFMLTTSYHFCGQLMCGPLATSLKAKWAVKFLLAYLEWSLWVGGSWNGYYTYEGFKHY